jgi:hypothetical protein
VLQPAVLPPAPLSHNLGNVGPPRYGELMDRATVAVEHAMSLGDLDFPDVHTAHHEVLGYQHFLRVSGRHLALLAGFATPSKHLRELSARLAALPAERPAEQPDLGRWNKAAVAVGIAHDLLASHVAPRNVGLTPDATDLLAHQTAGAGVSAMLTLLLEGGSRSWDLFHRAVHAQAQERDTELISRSQLVRLRHANRAIELFGKATLWDLGSSPRGADALANLDHLEPATPRVSAATRSHQFETSLAALQALRQISFRQGRGEDHTSATSLNDLARLAAQVTDPAASWLPEPTTALQRVQHAASRDHLAHAHTTWTQAATGLTTTIRGLARAPSPYGRAISRLLADTDTEAHDPSLNSATLSALPRMASEASAAIIRLTATGGLVTAERGPAALKVSWRPLTAAEGDDLAHRFTTAGVATNKALVTVHQLGNAHRQTQPTTPPRPSAHRQLTRATWVTR